MGNDESHEAQQTTEAHGGTGPSCRQNQKKPAHSTDRKTQAMGRFVSQGQNFQQIPHGKQGDAQFQQIKPPEIQIQQKQLPTIAFHQNATMEHSLGTGTGLIIHDPVYNLPMKIQLRNVGIWTCCRYLM
jgi:hypothetical protein